MSHWRVTQSRVNLQNSPSLHKSSVLNIGDKAATICLQKKDLRKYEKIPFQTSKEYRKLLNQPDLKINNITIKYESGYIVIIGMEN